jgi:hypothetical protein
MSPALLVVMIAALSANAARADMIGGPIFNQTDSGWTDSGVGFTANLNSLLTAFTFQNQGHADMVVLVDSLGNILNAVSIPAGTPSDTVSVSWSLTGGEQYYLLQTTASNASFSDWGLAAPADAQIALTNTGIFSYSLTSSAFGYGGDLYWTAFNDITTTSGSDPIPDPVPEPGSMTLVLPGMLAIWWRARRDKARTA